MDPNYFYVYLSSRTDGKEPTGKDVYLARVPKDRIFTRSAYAYFTGMDGNGNPIWSSSFSGKKPVFTDDTGMAYTINVSYNPALKRYIYAKSHSTSHLGIFEGANLWGPWKTLCYGQFRDNRWKFSYWFPQKWMSGDGKTLWMAWSGWPEYDNVNFMRVTLTPGEGKTPAPKASPLTGPPRIRSP